MLTILIPVATCAVLFFIAAMIWDFKVDQGKTTWNYGNRYRDAQANYFYKHFNRIISFGSLSTFVVAAISIPASVEGIEAKPNVDKLLVLQDNKGVEGSYASAFFISSGKVGEQFKYTFYYEGSEGNIGLVDTPTDRVIVYQDIKEGEQPYVEQNWHCNKPDSWWTNYTCDDPNSWPVQYKVHIPENTIRQDWTLDLK